MADAGKLKQQNYELIRNAMRDGRAYSKNDLARQTGLSFPTVSRILDEMTASGQARETGTGVSTGGRCAKQYALDPGYRMYLGVQFHGHKLDWFVWDLAGQQQGCGRADTEVGAAAIFDALITQWRAQFPLLAAGAIGYDHTAQQADMLKDLVSERLQIPVDVQPDIRLAAEGGCQRCATMPQMLVCIHLGRYGMRACAVMQGKPIQGAGGLAGELHTLPIKKNAEYAKNHFEGADMVAYYMQVIRAYSALLNPDRVVLYHNERIADRIERICRVCAQTLPRKALPVIEQLNTFEQDYQAGLIALADCLVEDGEK